MKNRRKIKKKQIKAWKNQKVNIRELEKLVKKEQRRKYKAEVKETKIKAEEKVSDLGRKKRMRNAILVSTITFIALICRIGWIQFVMGSELQSMAYVQQTLDRSVNPKRGTIYDATGKNILAISSTVETVTVNPTNIAKEDKEKVAKALTEIFNLNYETILKRVSRRSSIETIVKKIDKEKADELRKWLSDNNITKGVNKNKPKRSQL
jgi:cell division protein FtsI/penicillin-binding protein 2